jgi:hypothetical protein
MPLPSNAKVEEHVFIAYRSECGQSARALASKLRKGGERVFRDLAQLHGTDEWSDVLRAAIERSSAMVVLIDHSWDAVKDGLGDSRLQRDDDALRVEVREALRLAIPVIPVLVDHAKLPERERLPADIRGLCDRYAVPLRQTDFDHDVRRIAADVRQATDDRIAQAFAQLVRMEPKQARLESLAEAILAQLERVTALKPESLRFGRQPFKAAQAELKDEMPTEKMSIAAMEKAKQLF